MSSDQYQPLGGMSDLQPPDIRVWQHIESIGRSLLERYGFDEIRTPILERTDLFIRSLGDATDVVQKEMYRFDDRGGRDITLRPEGTAGVMRVIVGGGPDLAGAKFYYLGPMFRAERPQAGRKRQFHQLGAEAIGEPNPAADVECIALQLHLLNSWGLQGYEVQVNSLGDAEDRAAVQEGLRNELRPLLGELCPVCRDRFESNVLRILDCKNESCREIVAGLPPISGMMSESSRSYLAEVTDLLGHLGIEARLATDLVRGFDYYAHTVWEITHHELGAQDSLCGGGRYRFDFGAKSVQGVGFAMGLERVIMALEATGGIPPDLQRRVQVYIITQDPAALRENLVLAQTLRMRGFNCEIELRPRNIKKQLRTASRLGAEWVVIRGERELNEGTFELKNMSVGIQETLEMPEMIEKLTSALSLS